MAFTLPPLPYPYDALEPHIDQQTMMLHHDKHHAAYVEKANGALEDKPALAGKSVIEIVQNLDAVPEDVRTTVRNNAGGHVNHSMFWEIMTPGGSKQPVGDLAEAIGNEFGDFESFKKQFNAAGLGRFGSGWVWLVLDKNGKLQITSTPNQDSPYMEGLYPVMGNDVWEHAYYLKYQNRRGDYLQAWWNTVNWEKVLERYKNR